MPDMEILAHLRDVCEWLDESPALAMSLMALDVRPFLTDDAVAMLHEDAVWGPHFAMLDEGAAAEKPISSQLRSYSKEAHLDSKRARDTHRDSKASNDDKVQAHDDAEASHMFAGLHHEKAGHGKHADHHYRMADYHAKQREKLGVKHDYSEEIRSLLGEDSWDDATVGKGLARHSQAAFHASDAALMRPSVVSHTKAAEKHREAAQHAKDDKVHERHMRIASAHERAARYHARPKKKDEAADDDLRAANAHAHMAAWRAKRLQATIQNKKSAPKPQLKYSAVVKPAKRPGE